MIAKREARLAEAIEKAKQEEIRARRATSLFVPQTASPAERDRLFQDVGTPRVPAGTPRVLAFSPVSGSRGYSAASRFQRPEVNRAANLAEGPTSLQKTCCGANPVCR